MEEIRNNPRERVFKTQIKEVLGEAYPGRRNESRLNRSFERPEDYIRRKMYVGFERLHVFIIKGIGLIIGLDPLINEVIFRRDINVGMGMGGHLTHDKKKEEN